MNSVGGEDGFLIVGVPCTAVVFYVTQTRSALIGALCILLVWGITQRPALVLASLLGLAIGIGLLYETNPDALLPNVDGTDLVTILVTRFTDDEGLHGNAARPNSARPPNSCPCIATPFWDGVD